MIAFESPARFASFPIRRFLVCLGLLLGLQLLVDAQAIAEDGSVPNIQADQAIAPGSPRPIRVSDIGAESERTKGNLADILETIRPDGTIQNIVLALPTAREEITTFSAHSKQIQAGVASVSELDRLARDWDPLRSELSEFQDRLDLRVRRVDAAIDKIKAKKAKWAATRNAIDPEQVSEEVILQIDDVDAAIKNAFSVANAQQAAGVRTQSDVASLAQLTESDLSRISVARQAVINQAFRPDSAPIWSGQFWATLSQEEIAENFADIRVQYREAFTRFLAAQEQKISIYLACSLALIMLMFFLRQRVNIRLRLEEDVEALSAMVSRPISLGLLLSFIVALGVFAGSLRSLQYVLSAIAVVPAVLILRKLLPSPFYPALNVVLAVYFLENLRAMASGFPVFARVLFATEMVLLAVFSLLWLRRPRQEENSDSGQGITTSRGSRIGLRAVFLASSLALLANITGYTFLSRLVGSALAFGTYGSVVLYGSCRVLEGLASLAMSARPLNRLGMVRQNKPLLLDRFRLVLVVLASWLWVRAVLIRLELWPNMILAWEGLLATEVPLPQISITLGDILASIVVFYGALLVSRFIQFTLNEDIYPRLAVRTGRSSAISTLLHYGMLVLGFVFAAAALGFDANRFTLLAGALGVGIGFGLQTIVNNFFSGIILLTEQPIQVGDTIEMGGIFGEVQRIGIRSSTVRSFQGAEVIVPNADLISQQVTNWTLSDRKRRIEIPVGVAYGTDPDRVLEILTEVARNSDDVLPTPEPYALFSGFGDSSLNFELRAWTDDFDNFLRVKSGISARIGAALKEAAITIPFPQRDLHVRTLPPTGGD